MTDSDGPPIVTSLTYHVLRGVPTEWTMSLTVSADSRGPSRSPCRTSEEDAIILSPINNADGVE